MTQPHQDSRPDTARVQIIDAAALSRDQAMLRVDVRRAYEWATGHLPHAQHLEGETLANRAALEFPDQDQSILLYCQSGVRSLTAATALTQLGYLNVHSLDGGIEAWKAEGHSIVLPDSVPGVDQDRVRYARHESLVEVGLDGQARLRQATVLVVGAGGLGSPAAFYLAAAGVGTLRIVDHDIVDRSNLQRQILHRDEDVGMSKVESARRALLALNPSICVDTHQVRLDANNAEALVRGCDVVVDGCDNFATRYAVNAACIAAGVPQVHGSVQRFEGQLGVFDAKSGPCYRCVHPSAPPTDLTPNCSEAGVLGVLPGMLGVLQATETLKLLLGFGEPLLGKLATFDAKTTALATFQMRKNPECPACGPSRATPTDPVARDVIR